MIQVYFAQIKTVVDLYAATSFVLDAKISFEIRPGNQGYLTGLIAFADESTLHFHEYLDQTGDAIDKLMYAYHYQAADNQLVFRYDNARHRPALSKPEHKHIPQQVLQASPPTLDEILAEIATTRGWV